MSKTLQVIEPFFTLNVGDHFELTENGEWYAHKIDESFNSADVEGEDISSTYQSVLNITPAYAKSLIEAGYLAEEIAKTQFVNIFDEIDKLLYTYTTQLNNIDSEMKDAPICVKVEKTTVLQNMITLLTHLKNLKK